MTENTSFIHLVGEQTTPIYLSAIQFSKSCRHMLLCTSRTAVQAENIRKELARNGYQAIVKNLGPDRIGTDFVALVPVLKKILLEESAVNKDLAINVTGGTKPMAIVSLLLQKTLQDTVNCRYFYLDFAARELIWLDDLNDKIALTSTMTIENFIRLCGLKPKTVNSTTAQTRELSAKCYSLITNLQRFQAEMSMIYEHQEKQKFFDVYQELEDSIKDPRTKSEWHNLYKAALGNSAWTVQASYLAGGWFEDYIFNLIKEVAPQFEVMKNYSVIWDNNDDAQEFDVCYTDGYSLYILECKAGSVKQEYVQKLENICQRFSGALGKGALVSLNSSRYRNGKPVPFSTRIQESRNICAFCSKFGINELKNHVVSFVPKHIYESFPKDK